MDKHQIELEANINLRELLSPAYDKLPVTCIEPHSLPQGGLKFFKINEITYEDKSPRQEALENVLTSVRIPGINLIYLLRGKEDKVSFYFGVAADADIYNNTIQTDGVAEKILLPSLQGNFRGSKISPLTSEEIGEIQKYIKSKDLQYACVEGVPGVTKDKEKQDFQGNGL